MQDLISKADVLLEALPYLQQFRGQIFVIKYGGSFMDAPDPAARNSVARDIVFLESGRHKAGYCPRRRQGHYPGDGCGGAEG